MESYLVIFLRLPRSIDLLTHAIADVACSTTAEIVRITRFARPLHLSPSFVHSVQVAISCFASIAEVTVKIEDPQKNDIDQLRNQVQDRQIPLPGSLMSKHLQSQRRYDEEQRP
jgi:hypothetical protein